MSVKLNVVNAVNGELLTDLECELTCTIADLKSKIAASTGLLTPHQKLMLEDATELTSDAQTLQEAGLQSDSGKVTIKVVAGGQKLRRLDSVMKHASALDNFFAAEMQGQIDYAKDAGLAELLKEAVKENPGLVNDQAAFGEFSKKLQISCMASLGEKQRENCKKVFDDYDKNSDGSLSTDEIEKLLADLIVLDQKNLPLLIDTTLLASRDVSVEAAMMGVKAQFEGIVKSTQPGLEGAELDAAILAVMTVNGVTDEKIGAQLDQFFKTYTPVLVEGMAKCLQDLADDKENVAKQMTEEIDKNHDGKVDREEFAAHYYEAITKVIDMDKWIQALMPK